MVKSYSFEEFRNLTYNKDVIAVDKEIGIIKKRSPKIYAELVMQLALILALNVYITNKFGTPSWILASDIVRWSFILGSNVWFIRCAVIQASIKDILKGFACNMGIYTIIILLLSI